MFRMGGTDVLKFPYFALFPSSLLSTFEVIKQFECICNMMS